MVSFPCNLSFWHNRTEWKKEKTNKSRWKVFFFWWHFRSTYILSFDSLHSQPFTNSVFHLVHIVNIECSQGPNSNCSSPHSRVSFDSISHWQWPLYYQNVVFLVAFPICLSFLFPLSLWLRGNGKVLRSYFSIHST